MPGLSDAVLDLWYSAPEDKKWRLLEYSIENGEFTATFTYPEDMPPDESPYELRLRLVHDRFRNKKVIYPPWKHLS